MSFLKRFGDRVKNNAEVIALAFIIPGIVVLLFNCVLILCYGLEAKTELFALSLGLLSVGLGLVAIDMSTKSDKRQTELLQRLDRNVARLPLMIKGDTLTPSGQIMAKEMLSEQSKLAAQKRLDEDTKKVGFVRGELFQNEDGSWSIHWGGKYPL